MSGKKAQTRFSKSYEKLTCNKLMYSTGDTCMDWAGKMSQYFIKFKYRKVLRDSRWCLCQLTDNSWSDDELDYSSGRYKSV